MPPFLSSGPEDFAQTGRDALQRQNLDCRVERSGSLGHSVKCAARFILGNGVVTPCSKGLEAPGAVVAHAGEEYSDDFSWPVRTHTVEEDIYRRTMDFVVRLLCVADTGEYLDYEVIAATCEEDNSRREVIAFARDTE